VGIKFSLKFNANPGKDQPAGIHCEVKRKYTVNGVEYESPDAMPADVREIYERVMRDIKTGALRPGTPPGRPPVVPTAGPTVPEPALSRAWLILGLLVLLLTIVLYLRFR
jgi:hypothetical protein